MKIIPIIMSGGSGTRLWPLSTPKKPKQFHKIITENTLLQEALLRVKGDVFANPIIICNKSHKDYAIEQAKEINVELDKIILEPIGRNTAAVAIISALMAQKLDDDSLVIILPADQLITDVNGFHEAIVNSIESAKANIVTFGIKPNSPHTGFGYIEGDGVNIGKVLNVKQFHEKPALETAKEYLASGNYFWNAGIFLFSPKILLEEFAKYSNDTLIASQNVMNEADLNNQVIEFEMDLFKQIPSVSIDYGIMEHTKKACVIPCDIGWSDIGAYDQIWEYSSKNDQGNVGNEGSIFIDTSNSYIKNELKIPVSVIGLDDIAVIATDEGVLVIPKSLSQDVKKVQEFLKK